MTPTHTRYRLAREDDLPCLRSLFTDVGLDSAIEWPTVLGERSHGLLAGAITTSYVPEGFFFAGPSAIRFGGLITYLRLAQAYEAVMREAGMKFVLFVVPKEATELVNAIARWHLGQVHAQTADAYIFRREIH